MPQLCLLDMRWTAAPGYGDAISNDGHVVGHRDRSARPRALARFYSELLGWPIGHEEPGTAIVAAPQGSVYLVFQQADDYRAPVWPPVDGHSAR